MLSFDIRSLETRAVIVDEALPGDDPIWEADDPKPAGSVHVTGRLSSAGSGRFYWHGRIDGNVALECNRCLNETSAHVSDEAHIIFAESGDEETDDPDVYRLDPSERELDLRPAIREEWVLAAPTFGLCRDDCKGLCRRCGRDLNEGACDCDERSADPGWNALRNLGGSTR